METNRIVKIGGWKCQSFVWYDGAIDNRFVSKRCEKANALEEDIIINAWRSCNVRMTPRKN